MEVILIDRLLFILRRACLFGRVKNADVQNAFDISPDTARRDLFAAVDRWPAYLSHTPSFGVQVKPFATPPPEASSATFLNLMQNAAPAHELGLSKYEPVCHNQLPRFVYQGPEDRQLVMTLFKACLRRTPVDIEYVGLRMGEVRKVRTVLPLELELLGQQWRLIAQDVDVRHKLLDATQKNFVLARILHAQVSTLLQGKRLKSADGTVVNMKSLQVNRTERDYQVVLNRQMTADQVQALIREFALRQVGSVLIIRMPERNLAEFKRDHCARPVIPAAEDELKDFVLPVFESIRPYVAR